jgi:hypothetical protein
VLIRNLKNYFDAFLKAQGILLPGKIMKKNTRRVQANRFCPTELKIDPFRIERLGLPHFEFVDSRSGNVVAADEPRLLGVPFGSLLFTPSFCVLRGPGVHQARQHQDEEPCYQPITPPSIDHFSFASCKLFSKSPVNRYFDRPVATRGPDSLTRADALPQHQGQCRAGATQAVPTMNFFTVAERSKGG